MNTVGSLGTDLFSLDLRYNTPGSDALTASARYNGNISEMRWDTGTPKGYGFTYDGANRLKSSDYADGSSFTSNQNKYNTSYGYDNNGNLSFLSRFLNATKIDSLGYTYISSGNRLQSVNDVTGNSNGYDDNDGTYIYDDNGNLRYDPSKGTYIYYNYLNLPEQVQFGANDNLRYTYNAAGNKLVKVVDGTVAENNTRLDYSGNFLYENGDLKAIFTGEGRIIPFDNDGSIVYKFEYSLKDHLGNTRVVFSGHSNGKPEVMQITDYYPFGLVMNQQNYFASGVLSNKFLYNGKELQDDEVGGSKLDWYDYGGRANYDPQLGRWHSIDPKAEKFYSLSSYTAFANNPLLFIDPTGEEIFIYHWVSDGDGGGQWVQGHMNKDTQKQLEAFAKTKGGYAFLSQYAKSGQKIGSVEFKTDGKYADQNLNFNEFDSYASPAGTYSMREGKDKLNFDIQLNTAYMDDPNGKEAYSLTIGHEAFIHMDQVDDALIKAYKEKDTKTFNLIKQQEAKDGAVSGDIDHRKYINGDPAFSRFNTYSSQLKQVLNPQSVEKAKKEHDAKYSRLLIKK